MCTKKKQERIRRAHNAREQNGERQNVKTFEERMIINKKITIIKLTLTWYRQVNFIFRCLRRTVSTFMV